MSATTTAPVVEVKGNTLVISMPLETPTPSKSGKSLVVASTYGFHTAGSTLVNGRPVTVTVSAFIPK